MDVQRKAVILARVLGHEVGLSDVPVEAIFPPRLAQVPYAEFLERVCNAGELDKDMSERLEAAAVHGRVLRYVAKLSAKGVAVGIQVGEPCAALPSCPSLAAEQACCFLACLCLARRARATARSARRTHLACSAVCSAQRTR